MHRIEALTAAVAALTEAINASHLQASKFAEAYQVAEQPKQEKAVKTPKPSAQQATTTEPQVTTTPESTAVTEPAATQTTAEQAAAQEPKASASAPTYDDVRAAFLELNTKKGRDATVAALGKLGAQKVPDIKPEQFANAIDVAKQLLAA